MSSDTTYRCYVEGCTEPPCAQGAGLAICNTHSYDSAYWPAPSHSDLLARADRAEAALKEIADGNWNVGAEKDVTCRKFARDVLAGQEGKP